MSDLQSILTMASNYSTVIYESGEDRKPDWKEAAAAYNEEGTMYNE